MMRAWVLATVASGLAFSAAVAQEASTEAKAVGMVQQPCAALPPVPASMIALREAMLRPGPPDLPAMVALTQQPDYVAYAAAEAAQKEGDWAGLCVYREANAEALADDIRPDVVMMGDSITENWARADAGLFRSRNIVGRGISGQTSGQMLVRFRADVVDLRPRVVHILAGTNDIAGNAGPTSPEAYQDNIQSMVDLARANGVQVVLGAIPPARGFFWRPEVQPREQIVALNNWLREYAAREGLVFIDYHAALHDGQGGLGADMAVDGVHPNRDAYAIMDALLLKAVN